MKRITYIAIAATACVALVGTWILSGLYSMAADAPHSAVVTRLIETLRDRSIASHARGAKVPDLEAAALVAEGAEHYAAMCVGCHLAPGLEDSELRPGLYPQPPILAKRRVRDPAENFWIIKHGIKMSAMPAWGATHDDEAIWGMVAFLRKLQGLSPDAYQQLVARGRGEGANQETHEHGQH